MPMDRLAGHCLFTHPVMCPPFQFAINNQNYEGRGGWSRKSHGRLSVCLSPLNGMMTTIIVIRSNWIRIYIYHYWP